MPSLNIALRTSLLGAGLLALPMSARAQVYETGNVCIDDYTFPQDPQCTANDVSATSVSVLNLVAGCGDITPNIATVRLQMDLRVAPDHRFDLGLFLATDGLGAAIGEHCYHEYFPPPWPSLEPAEDVCGDALQGDYQRTLETDVDITCVDEDLDGTVDAQLCFVWKQSPSLGTASSPHCISVQQAIPESPSKCHCQLVNLLGLPVLPNRMFANGFE